MKDLRCEKCDKLLCKYEEPTKIEIKCKRCGTMNVINASERVRFTLSSDSSGKVTHFSTK